MPMRIVKSLLITLAVTLSTSLPVVAQSNIINLTQTNCQFIETEKELKNPPKTASGCKAFNQTSLNNRKFIPLKLKAGRYIFRVKNRDVGYDLGFWLRGKGLKRLTLPSVSGGGIQTGTTKDYNITLKKGNYLYSCPLNPTPDYPLTVD